MPIKKEIDKETRIKRERTRLNKVFKTLDKNKLTTVQSLINNAAFMAVTLEDLQAEINVKGISDKYQNGANQWGTKQSPEVEVYIAMSRNLTTVIKELASLAPPEKRKDSKLEALRQKNNAG